MKSLWLLVYYIISTHNPHGLKSSGAFCQASGFLLSVGIEAADAAVFLIALHSSVYIFWANRAGGETGLYPYRRTAYSFYVLWPISMASLAFVKGAPVYVNTGQSCYLPMAPWWYRISLTWAPRYAILLIIVIMYGSSYTYVRIMMRRYSRRSSEIPMARPNRLVPSLPPLLSHGLLPTPPGSSFCSSSRIPSGSLNPTEFPQFPPEHQLNVKSSFNQRFGVRRSNTQMKGDWSWPGFNAGPSLNSGPVSTPAISPMGIMIPGIGAAEPIWETDEVSTPHRPPKTALYRHRPATDSPPSSIQTPNIVRDRAFPDLYRRPTTINDLSALVRSADDCWDSQLVLDPLTGATLGNSSRLVATQSQVHIGTMLWEGPLRATAAGGSAHSSSSSSSVVMALDQATFESGGISRSRDRMRRQLRLLFVYPAVYACVWVFPFASDLYRFRSEGSDGQSGNGPFWLGIVSLISLCAQGLCDTVVFLSRERPWRHMRGGFRESFDLEFVRQWRRFTATREDGGRTREEMFNDSTRARSRRVEELEREHEYRGSPSGRMPPTAGAMNWFDVDLYDGNQASAQADAQADEDARAEMRGRRRASQPFIALQEEQGISA